MTNAVVLCGGLFDALGTEMRRGMALEIGADGLIASVREKRATDGAAKPAIAADYSDCFVIPGLIDIHVHLSYGNAKTEEDIDLYASVELRAIRGLLNAQRALMAGC